MAPLQLDGVIHVLGLPPGHLHRVDVGAAVYVADVYQHRGGRTDAGNGVVYVPLILDAGIGYGMAAVAEGAGEAEEVAHHVVGEPEVLKAGQAVGYEYAVLRLGADYTVYLHREGLKAHRRVQHVLLHIGPPLYQGLVVHHLGVVGKTQVHDTLLRPGYAGHQLAHHKHIVPHVLYLPGHRVPPAQVVQGLVQALDAGAYIFGFSHWPSSFSHIFFRKRAARGSPSFYGKIINEEAGLWQQKSPEKKEKNFPAASAAGKSGSIFTPCGLYCPYPYICCREG